MSANDVGVNLVDKREEPQGGGDVHVERRAERPDERGGPDRNREVDGRPAGRPGEQQHHARQQQAGAAQAESEQAEASAGHRLGKPVSEEALQAAEAILDRYPKNFRPQGRDACNPIVLADMRRQIEELLEAGAIERCLTQPSSVYAVVMVRKPGQPGKWRLCLDLQPLNANTVPMPYAMPDVHEALDRLSGDGANPPQIYQWKKMCFGPFVDDIVIASDTLEEHLGFILSEEGQALDPARIESLLAIGAPHNLKGLKSLMGATAKRMGFHWGPDYTKTFHVSMDASDVGVGAVLWQWQMNADGELVPQAIMYCSRRFSDRERR